MTEPETEPAPEDEFTPDPAATMGDDLSHDKAVDEAVDEQVDEQVDEPVGIPDEPEPFVEEIAAAADLPETGDARVDEVLGRLSGIEQLPPGEHVAVYDEVHRGLQDALANLDQG